MKLKHYYFVIMCFLHNNLYHTNEVYSLSDSENLIRVANYINMFVIGVLHANK